MINKQPFALFLSLINYLTDALDRKKEVPRCSLGIVRITCLRVVLVFVRVASWLLTCMWITSGTSRIRQVLERRHICTVASIVVIIITTPSVCCGYC